MNDHRYGSAGQKSAEDGQDSAGFPNLPVEEDPVTTGTLFIMILFLMAMGALWALMYFTLLGR